MRATRRIDYLERRLRSLELEVRALRRLAEAGMREPKTLEPKSPEPLAAVGVEAPLPPPARTVPAQPSPPSRPRPEPEHSRGPAQGRRGSDLLGARALAWTGGVVTLFGIVLFFALAVNRGWIGEGARVVLGAGASALVFAGGLLLRRRFGETHAAVAAVGAGIGGAYATLLAAGPYYDLVPDRAALVLAGCVAAVAGVLALAWSSELVAGIGIVGALAVPVPIAWGDGVTTTGNGFVALMFAASAVVAVHKRWRALLVASAIVVVPQVIALAAEHSAEAAVGPLVATAACSAILLAAGIGLHLRAGPELEPFQATVMMAAALLAGLCTALLLDAQGSEGYALLAVAAVYAALALPAYFRGRRDLGLYLFAVALAAAAVGCADVLSGASLGLAWAAEAAVLAWLARRILDLRVQLAALVYLGLAVGHAVLIDTPPSRLFVESDHPATGAASLLAASAACAVVAWCCGGGWSGRRPGGVYAVIGPLLESMRARQPELRFGTGWLAGFGAVYAACLGLLALPGSWEWHEVAVTAVLTLVPVGVLVLGLVLPWRELQLAAALGLGIAVLKNVGYDLARLDAPQRSWTMAVVGAALLAAGFLFQRFALGSPGLSRFASAVVGATVAYAIAAPVDLLEGDWHGISRAGLALLLPAAVYAGLCTLVFRIGRLRDFATLLWADALVVALVAATLLFDGTATAAAVVALGLVLVALGVRLDEERFQVGAAVCLALGTLHAVIVDAPPSRFFESNAHPASGAAAVAAAAGLALALARVAVVPERLGRSRVPLFALAGVLALYAASLVVLELFQLGGSRIETAFERGHAAVSALWGLLALVLLYLGLTRRLSLRIAGFVLFGATLVKIFLFDLATLSSVARALSFLAVGGVLLLGGFFYQRLSTDALRRREAAGR